MTQATTHANQSGYWMPQDAYLQIRTARATAETLLDFLDAAKGYRVELTVAGLHDMLAGGILDNLNFDPFETFACPRPERSALEEKVCQGIRVVLGKKLGKRPSRRRPLR